MIETFKKNIIEKYEKECDKIINNYLERLKELNRLSLLSNNIKDQQELLIEENKENLIEKNLIEENKEDLIEENKENDIIELKLIEDDIISINNNEQNKEEEFNPIQFSSTLVSYVVPEMSLNENNSIINTKSDQLKTTTDSNKIRKVKIKSAKKVKNSKRKLDQDFNVVKRRKIGYKMLEDARENLNNINLLKDVIMNALKPHQDLLQSSNAYITEMKTKLEEAVTKSIEDRVKYTEEIKSKDEIINSLNMKINELTKIISENNLTIKDFKVENDQLKVKNDQLKVTNNKVCDQLKLAYKKVEDQQKLISENNRERKVLETKTIENLKKEEFKKVDDQNDVIEGIENNPNKKFVIKKPITVKKISIPKKKETINIDQMTPMELYKKSVDSGSSLSSGRNTIQNKGLHRLCMNYIPKTMIPHFGSEEEFSKNAIKKGGFFDKIDKLLEKNLPADEIRKFLGNQCDINVEQIFNKIPSVTNYSPNQFNRIQR
ncbi:hypothetical protein HERIO_1149 [Hepatospora eriocheir]|uniref:Uncharacterized protein n=1 Tax=Hepatospora eriocheir TaxID=1081669 RepID=A0A1X0QAY2_9MICR|nr:hypothetical protein HERIO_1149 [Hepatospora eriocheir]